MRRLVVLVPDWPVLATGHRRDELVAVIEHGRVLAATPEARARGVHRGQRRRDAEAHATGLVCCERDPASEARLFEPVLAALGALTTGLEVVRPGLCALATRGPARYFGGEDALAEIVRSCTRTALVGTSPAWIGIADGHLAAVLAARAGRIVAPGGDDAFLAPFPLSVLGPSRLTELLAALGVTTLGAFAALGEGLVGARFGREGLRAWRRASGREPEALTIGAPVPELCLTTELDPPGQRVDEVAFATRTATEELVEHLSARGLSCGQVVIDLVTEHGESLRRVWRAPVPLVGERIAERLRWQLEGWLSAAGHDAPTGGVTLVRLAAEALHPERGSQLGLLEHPREDSELARRSLDRLSGLLGEHGVLLARLGGGRGPAERVELNAWGAEVPERDRAGPWPGQQSLPAPAVVYAAPRPCEVLDHLGAPVAVNGRGAMCHRPARLRLEGTSERKVRAFAGPWLYEEAWWTARGRRRARLQLYLTDDSAHLCFLEHGAWWLEASYD